MCINKVLPLNSCRGGEEHKDNSGFILLTGATGFLGSHLLSALILNNFKVIILKRSFSLTDRLINY